MPEVPQSDDNGRLVDALCDDDDERALAIDANNTTTFGALHHDRAASALALHIPTGVSDDELVPLVDLVMMSSDEAEPMSDAHSTSVVGTAATNNTQQQPPALTQPQPRRRTTSNDTAATTIATTRRSTKHSRTTNTNANSKKPSANKARDARTGELVYLRAKVSELETQLRSVHANRLRLTAAVATNSASTHQPSAATDNTLAILWRDVATHQRAQRTTAEQENSRLRLVLENQLKVAKSFEAILNKRSTTKDLRDFADRRSPITTSTSTKDDARDAQEFATLQLYVEQMVADIDAVFRENGLAHTETPFSRAEMRANVVRGMFLEICANKLLPFSVSATGDAVWHHFAVAKERTPFRCYTYTSSQLRSTADTIIESFVLKLDAKGTDANLRVKQVLRRHVEADRTVIVWRAAFEAFEFAHEPVAAGTRYHENGYIVIKRPAVLAGSDASDTHALLQTCYITTPNFPTDDVSILTNPRVGAISDFVLAATAANVSATNQMIENVLLEQALASRGRQVCA